MNILERINAQGIWLTDGGLETTLIFDEQIELSHFSAFPLVEDPEQNKVLMGYYRPYLELAKAHQTGFILETATYKASRETGYLLGYSAADLDRVNQQAIAQMVKIRKEYADDIPDLLISGCIGPRYDGYSAANSMTAGEAADYHRTQIASFKSAGADMVSAYTLNTIAEATGLATAAQELQMPVVISFTVETNGRLIDGTPLKDAIEMVDTLTNQYPVYYMINCAHSTHFESELGNDSTKRIMAIRANSSCKSHEELDNATELDRGDIQKFGAAYVELKTSFPNLKVFGGCCGTSALHLTAFCKAINENAVSPLIPQT